MFSKRIAKAYGPRRIPPLNPAFFREIHESILRAGGSGTLDETAFGITNAIYNTGGKILSGFNKTKKLQEFDRLYGQREVDDPDIADEMVDYLCEELPEANDLLVTLLGRLREVYAKPDPSAHPEQRPAPAPAPAQPVASTPMVEQLAQLHALHQEGGLTDAEFGAAKRRILG